MELVEEENWNILVNILTLSSNSTLWLPKAMFSKSCRQDLTPPRQSLQVDAEVGGRDERKQRHYAE